MAYLGEEKIIIEESEFKDYTPSDWAMYFIGSYGQIDGDHHKLWVLDQVSRILKGSKIKIKLAKWSTGECEYRISVGKPTVEYKEWVKKQKGEYVDGEYEYSYDKGIAP